MKAIEITEAKLAIFHGQTLAREMVLPGVRPMAAARVAGQREQDEVAGATNGASRRTSASLSEIRLRLRSSGVYRNGDRREYWQNTI